MDGENLALTMPSMARMKPLYEVLLTQEESLERLYWSLQVDFEDLCEKSPEEARRFAEWANSVITAKSDNEPI